MNGRKHPLLAVLLLTAICAAAALPARAALFERGLWEFDFSAGHSLPKDISDVQYRKSTALKASALRKIRDWVSVGLETSYSTGYKMKGVILGRDFDTPLDGVTDTLEYDSDAKRYMFSALSVARIGNWFEFEGAVLRPYAIVGIGLYYSWNRPALGSLFGQTSQKVDMSNTRFLIDSKDRINAGINLGIGLDQKLSERFSVGVDLRLHHIFNAYDSNSDGTDNAGFTLLAPSLKLTYYY